jgi:hypothetical protein
VLRCSAATACRRPRGVRHRRLTSSRSSTCTASKRLISSRSTNNVSKRSARLQELSGTPGRRVEVVTGLVQHRPGEPDGRRRRTQLVDTSRRAPLHRLSSSVRIWRWNSLLSG